MNSANELLELIDPIESDLQSRLGERPRVISDKFQFSDGTSLEIADLHFKKLTEAQRKEVLTFKEDLVWDAWLEPNKPQIHPEVLEVFTHEFDSDLREEVIEEWDDLYYYIRRKKNEKC